MFMYSRSITRMITAFCIVNQVQSKRNTYYDCTTCDISKTEIVHHYSWRSEILEQHRSLVHRTAMYGLKCGVKI